METTDKIKKYVTDKISKNFNGAGILGLTIFIVFLSVFAMIFVSLYINRLLYKKDEEGCNIINLLTPGTLSSIDTGTTYSFPVNFYYIKTAYNCCSEGSYVNGFVNLCVLEKIITQGVRCFDFEIFNIDDVAVVSTSTTDNYFIKETLNYVLFSSALETIVDQAFSSSYCSNYSDPVFISLRMKTNNISVYNNLAETFQAYTDPYLLPDEYSYENRSNFCGTVILKSLIKKIVIMVNSPSIILQTSNLNEFVNIVTGPSSSYFKYIPFSEIKSDSQDDTISYTLEKGLFVSPTVENGNPINPESSVCFIVGAQFVGMSFQYNDTNLQAYQAFFEKYTHAFIMKNQTLLPKKYNLKITVPGEESNPNKCNEIKMGDTVVSTFGSGCN